jgi:hypothetical protein
MYPWIQDLKDSKDWAMMMFSGSWFHILMMDGNNDSLCTVVRQNGILYRSWCPLVAAPDWLNWGGSCVAIRELTLRYITVALALVLHCCCLFQSVNFSCDTTVGIVVVSYGPSCSSLHRFYFVYVYFSAGVPDSGCIFDLGSDPSLEAFVLDVTWAGREVPS